ncbi:MAG: hypothetical protein ACPIOQ_59635, partial [Promethearchaeia archaeon]
HSRVRVASTNGVSVQVVNELVAEQFARLSANNITLDQLADKLYNKKPHNRQHQSPKPRRGHRRRDMYSNVKPGGPASSAPLEQGARAGEDVLANAAAEGVDRNSKAQRPSEKMSQRGETEVSKRTNGKRSLSGADKICFADSFVCDCILMRCVTVLETRVQLLETWAGPGILASSLYVSSRTIMTAMIASSLIASLRRCIRLYMGRTRRQQHEQDFEGGSG